VDLIVAPHTISWRNGARRGGSTHCTAPRNDLIRAIIEDFATRLVSGGILIYAGHTGKKWSHFDAPLLAGLGVNVHVCSPVVLWRIGRRS
jgi:BsuBI/PstI restriction endonuclease domain